MFLLLLSGCIQGLPEYISFTQSDTMIEVFASFSALDLHQAKEYVGVSVISIKPDYYYEQNIPFCGGFSIAGILSAYGLVLNESISTYMSGVGKLVGGMSPVGVISSLANNGITGTIKRAAGLSFDEKIQVLRDEVDSGRPVMVLLGNGYQKDGVYSYLKSQEAQSLHWITVWGYHDDGFFVYDSLASPNLYDAVPIGNRDRTNSEMVRDWGRPSYFTLLFGNTYITLFEPFFTI